MTDNTTDSEAQVDDESSLDDTVVDDADETHESDESETDSNSDEEESTTDTESDDSEIEEESTEGQEDDSEEDSATDEYITKLRNEAKKYRLRLRTAESELEALKNSSPNEEVTTLTNRVTELETTLKRERLSNALTAEAAKHNAIDPNVLNALVNVNDVEWDGDSVKDINSVIVSLREKYPKLFSASNGVMNAGTRSQTPIDSDMTPQERIRSGFNQ